MAQSSQVLGSILATDSCEKEFCLFQMLDNSSPVLSLIFIFSLILFQYFGVFVFIVFAFVYFYCILNF